MNLREKMVQSERDFILVAGAAVSFVSFLLSFVGVVDSVAPYFYFFYFYILTLFVVGFRFDKGKTVVTALVFSILHLIYVFFFYPDDQSSMNYTSGIFYNIFLVLLLFLSGFIAQVHQKKWRVELEDSQKEEAHLRKEMGKARDDKNLKNTQKQNGVAELLTEKRLQLHGDYLLIEEEIIRAIIKKRKDFLQFYTGLLQARLRVEQAELFIFADQEGWSRVFRCGREAKEQGGGQDRKDLCKAVAEEAGVVSSHGEIMNKYKLKNTSAGGILAMPILKNEKVFGVIVLDGFKEQQMMDDIERFCQRLAVSLAKTEEA
ncbi:MAG: hypothetical protein PHQ23_00525 [Candidatus Wallbacteria bacterium]|nr:hypothetical protein [Candidatus Wallbacteria bacterium]